MTQDEMLCRIHDLADTLQERLTEAEDIRARLTNARREANSWPDLHPAPQPIRTLPDLPYFRAPDDDCPTH
jgi:hypothetical protein